jgi:probable HAF family extracellular repeat protein
MPLRFLRFVRRSLLIARGITTPLFIVPSLFGEQISDQTSAAFRKFRGFEMISRIKKISAIAFSLFILCLLFGGQSATMQQREDQASSAPPVAAPAAGIQLQPQIAKGGNSSLAVWADKRTVLGRYVPDDNAGIGSDTDIYAARYDADGNLIDTSPIVVSEALYEQYSPHVAWNGQNWLVVWITKRPTNQFWLDIYAARVAPDGRVLDATPIVISMTPDSSGNPTYLRVASDGVNWSVIFGTGSSNSSILGVRVANDGSLIDPTPKVLYQDVNFTAPFWADLAYANDQFLLVWAYTTGSTHSIRAERLSANLDPVGAPFKVNFNGSDGTAARVASDGSNFLVVWREDRFAYSEIFAARVNSAGQVLDANGIKLWGSPGEYSLPFNVALCWDGTNYVAAYHGRPVQGGESIFASRVSPFGTASSPIPVVLNNGSAQPGVGALVAGGAQIVWVDGSLSADGDIFGARLAADGTLGTPSPTSLAAPRQTQTRFTKTETGDFAYVYRSTISGESSIYLQRLNASGEPLGDPTLVVSGPEAIITPAVAWNGAHYLVVWELSTQIYGRRVAADGTTAGEAFPIMPGNTPDVAALTGQFLVVDTYEPVPHTRFTQAVRVSQGGTVLGSPVKIGNNFDLRPRVRALGFLRWLVVWESDISHDNPNSTIVGAFVDMDGISSGEFGISSTFGDAPNLAAAFDTALVVWQDGGKIYGRRIEADGTLLGGSFLIAQSPRTLFAPAAAWDGSRFVVTFADSRNRTTLPPPDIWATLVGLDGSLLTPNHFPVAASPLPEEMPAVEAMNGTTIFAYSLFEDRAPYTSYRVRLRRFPFDTNYNVTATPYQRQIAPGGTTTFTINVNPQNNFTGEVALSVYGLPGGASASFSPPTLQGGGTSILTVTTSNATLENIYRLTVTATSGAQQSTTEVVLFVDDNPPPVGYSVTDLGTLGGTESAAYGINESGQIVGYAFNSAQKRRAFLYTNGQMRDLGTLGGPQSTAFAVNDTGQVVGVSEINGFQDSRAFWYDGTTMRNLGTLSGGTGAGSYSAAYSINNSNQIVGQTSDGGQRIAFIYQNGQMQFVGTPYAFDTADDINDAGRIVGSEYVGDGITKSYLLNGTQVTYIETLGGRASYAHAVNSSDQVVGEAEYSVNNIFKHAFLYSNGQLRDLNAFGAPQSFAYDINDAGQIVGNINLTTFSDPRAFIHDGTTMRNLNSLIPQNSGWVLQEARSINNNGQIVGKGLINNQTHAFLLAPNGSQNAPPTVQITSPSSRPDGESTAITISAEAFDTDGTIVRVEFYADGQFIGAQHSVPYAILWTPSTGNHTYTITARAFDDGGAMTVSAPVTITIGGSSGSNRFDFDGDGKTDISIYSNGNWYVNQSGSGSLSIQFGLATDKIVPADYDGDGKTDIAVWRESNSTWYIMQSSNNSLRANQFGLSGDKPAPADFDGDGKTDLVVYRPSNGTWYILQSTNSTLRADQWGVSEDKPVPADYDGDGRADLAVFRPSQATWYIYQSTNNSFRGQQWGLSTDKPVAGDYDRDGKVDVAVWRASDGYWYALKSGDGAMYALQWGANGDLPVPGDYDGDGQSDAAVWRASTGTWYILRSSDAAVVQHNMGASGDVPVPSAYPPQ